MDIRPNTLSDSVEQLTERQREVVMMACEGLSNRGIAETLGLTESTVKNHLHAIYEKIGVRSRIEVIIALAERSR